MPVLVLSARNDTNDKIRALRLGADDYMTKPFWPSELVERVRARLRRPRLEQGDVVEAHGLRIDVEGRSVSVEGRSVSLTPIEFEFSALACAAAGRRARGLLGRRFVGGSRRGATLKVDRGVQRVVEEATNAPCACSTSIEASSTPSSASCWNAKGWTKLESSPRQACHRPRLCLPYPRSRLLPAEDSLASMRLRLTNSWRDTFQGDPTKPRCHLAASSNWWALGRAEAPRRVMIQQCAPTRTGTIDVASRSLRIHPKPRPRTLRASVAVRNPSRLLLQLAAVAHV